MAKAMTKKELATIAGYTYRQLYNIDRDLPENKKLFVECEGSKCDLAIFVQRWVDFNVNRNSVDADDLDVVKARHETIKIQKTELEVERLRGTLIDVQDVRILWGTVANTVMQGLIHLPGRIAPLLLMMDDEESISSIIDEEIRKVLDSLKDVPLPGDEENEEVNYEVEESGDGS